jgi:hypothetical protein
LGWADGSFLLVYACLYWWTDGTRSLVDVFFRGLMDMGFHLVDITWLNGVFSI